MHTRTRFAPMAGVSLSVMGLVIALSFNSPTLAQKEAPALKDEPSRGGALPPIGDVPQPAPAPVGEIPQATIPVIESVPAGGRNTVDPASSSPFDPIKPEPATLDSSAVAVTQGAAGVVEDPEKTAQEFVDRTRKEADAAIKSLTAEAETLRTRLKRVEAGLQRWQSLRAALDQNQNSRKTAAAEKKAWKQMEGRELPQRVTSRTIEAVPTEDLPAVPERAVRAEPDRVRARGESIQRK